MPEQFNITFFVSPLKVLLTFLGELVLWPSAYACVCVSLRVARVTPGCFCDRVATETESGETSAEDFDSLSGEICVMEASCSATAAFCKIGFLLTENICILNQYLVYSIDHS